MKADAKLPEGFLEEVKAFMAKAELRKVFLKGAYGDCFVAPDMVEAKTTKTTIEPEASFLRREGFVVVLSKLTLQGRSNKEKVFEFQQVLCLVYECGHEQYSDDTIKFFAERNGTYNAWPFHRELIQSTMTRMGIPVFVLPLINPYRADKQVTASGSKPELDKSKKKVRRNRKEKVQQ